MLIANVLKNRAFELSLAEKDALESVIARTRTFDAGQIVVPQDVSAHVSTLLVKGLITRHFDAPDGRRHLVAVHVPGDFVDLHAYALKRLDHDVSALTAVSVAIFPHPALERIQELDMRLTRRLWFLTLLDAAMHRQWIFRLSSLNAIERVAHFLCEMNARLLAIGDSDGTTFALPMTQSNIGEVCSLTNVHVNRVLRELRETGLCHLRSSRVHIIDLKQLVAKARFDPGYLYLNASMMARAAGRPEVPDV
ncbi:MAG TPA: Crp/Fnr family transcriptional regulator [Variovorax sp.]|nr:Crp/Fnr family transcriptional regulator [Variovorax sp.]